MFCFFHEAANQYCIILNMGMLNAHGRAMDVPSVPQCAAMCRSVPQCAAMCRSVPSSPCCVVAHYAALCRSELGRAHGRAMGIFKTSP